MIAPASKLGSKPDGAPLSPPSSPEMDFTSTPLGPRRWLQQFPEGSLSPWNGSAAQYDAPFTDHQGITEANTGNSHLTTTPLDHQVNPTPSIAEQIVPSSQALDFSYSTNPQMSLQRPLPTETFCPSLNADREIQSEEIDLLSPTSVEGEGAGTGEAAPKTAAELRAEKRKMKRFRLTHNQTRFLMNEYARQAHPDAAQRGRLSREIPGLSPRQVQVWFQNRRAKLKRLTADDQERMLKSRALPVGFDTAQALHYASDAPAHAGSGRASSFFQPIHHEYDASRPITTGRFRSGSEASGIASTTSLTSSFGNFYLTPGSVPASEAISPTSPPSDISHFFTPPVSHGASPCMQANSVRPRATSLALPCLMRQEENYSFNSGNIYQGDQSQNYLQQNCSIDGKPPTGTTQGQHLLYNVGVSMPYVPIVHGGPQSNLQSDSTNDGFFGSSYITSTAEYPRRASEGIIGQRRRHLIPVRPLQSAPSVAPPDFSTVQSSSPSQLGEAGPPFYTNVPRSYYPW